MFTSLFDNSLEAYKFFIEHLVDWKWSFTIRGTNSIEPYLRGQWLSCNGFIDKWCDLFHFILCVKRVFFFYLIQWTFIPKSHACLIKFNCIDIISLDQLLRSIYDLSFIMKMEKLKLSLKKKKRKLEAKMIFTFWRKK